MTAVAMSDEDREELAKLVREIEEAENTAAAKLAERNALMHRLFNSYLADIPDIEEITGMRRPTVAKLVRGPRTRGYRQKQAERRKL
jgi:hypothetical protein